MAPKKGLKTTAPKKGPTPKKASPQFPDPNQPKTPTALQEKVRIEIEEKKKDGISKLKQIKRRGMRNQERGYNVWRRIIDKQIIKMKELGDKTYNKAKKITLSVGKSVKKMNEEINKIIDKYNETIAGIVEPLIQTLESVLAGKKYLTAKDLEKFKRIYKVYRDRFSKYLAKKPKLRKELTSLIKQLRKRKPLTQKQMKILVNMVNAKEISKMTSIENTRIGFFLNIMSPKQKTQFLREVIKSPKNNKHSIKIIDSLIKTAVISVRQGHELMKEALSSDSARKKIKTAVRNSILKKFTDGTYNRLQNKTLKERQKIVKSLKEKFYKNPAMRYLSATSVGGILAFVWGFLTASINLIVNRGRLNKEAIWGLSAMAVGTMAVQKGRQTDRRGIIGTDSPFTEFTRSLIFKENKETLKNLKKKEHVQTYADIYSNFPLHDYFNSGGYDVFYQEYQSRKRSQAHVNKSKLRGKIYVKFVSYQDLVRLESRKSNGNAKRLARLKRAVQLMPGTTKQDKINYFNKLLRRLANAAEDTGKKTTKDYKTGIDTIRELYGFKTKKKTK